MSTVSKYFTLLLLILLISAAFNPIPKYSPYYEHYYFLSKSLLKGKVDLTEQLKVVFDSPVKLAKVFDYAIFEGRHYLHLGIFPGILGIPFLIFGLKHQSMAMFIFLLTLTLVVLNKMVRHFLGKNLSIALLLFFSSPLLTSLTWKGPWYLNGLAVFCWGLLFLWHSEVKKRNWATLFILPLFLTRPTTIFYSLIPLWKIFTQPQKRQKKALILIITLAISLFTFTSYNYLRFNNLLEAGYNYVVVPQEKFREYRKEAFSPNYLISNALYMFVNPPRAYLNKALRFTFPYFELSRFGVGLIFTIPWFFSYLFFNRKKRQDWLYLITAGAILGSILFFGGEGSFQIGPRYACDFLPLLVFLNLKWLSQNKQKVPLFKKLLYLSFILNLYFYFLVTLGHIRRV